MTVVEKVRELAADSPDNKYLDSGDTCFYTRGPCSNGSCGCIIGQALLACNVAKETLKKYDTGVVPHASLLVKDCFPDTSDSELGWLNKVQVYQDTGATWGEAVENADE